LSNVRLVDNDSTSQNASRRSFVVI
jgi:hypothetical protein